MRKQLLFFSLLFFCFCPVVEAQLCNESYEATIHYVHIIEQTADGGYIIGGKSVQDVSLIKIDALGNEQWRQNYPNEVQVDLMDIAETTNGEFQISGRGFGAYRCIFWMRIKRNGELIWKRNHLLENYDDVNNMKFSHTNDNEIFLCGREFQSSQEPSALLMKMNSDGEILQKSLVVNPSNEILGSEFTILSSTTRYIDFESTGKPVIAGHATYLNEGVLTASFSTIFTENSIGELEWALHDLASEIDKPFNTEHYIIDFTIDKSSNSSTFISRMENEFSNKRTIFRGGKTIFFDSLFAKHMTQTTDGHFIIVGQESNQSIYHWKLIKLDNNGNQIWKRLIAKTPPDSYIVPRDIIATNDNGFILIGMEDEYIHLTKYDSNGFSCQNYIQGAILNDSNYNCELEEEEKAISDIKLKINGESFLTTVNSSGSYSLPLDSGTYNISISTTPDIWEANCEEEYTVTFDELYQTIEGIDFALQPSIPCNLMNVDVEISRARACREGRLAIQYCNDGNIDAENIRIELQISSLLENITSSTPFMEENGLYIFEPDDLEWGKCRSIYMNYQVVCDAPFDEEVCVETRIFPNDHCGEARPIDESTTCLNVTNSYDPNDISVSYEQPIGGGDCIVESGLLDYTIRFQNTGNDTAYRVMIMDTLPPSVELESFRQGASSHNYQLEFHQPNVLVWIFDDINLLDSLNNEPESHGFVSFSIRQKSENTEGLVIANQAHIYFDFNAPIATNIAAVQNCLKTTLPVDFTAFNGEAREKGNFIEWETASEVNNDYFQLEHSQNGKNFEVIALVNSIGTTSKPQQYNFLHTSPFNGVNYYRLSQVDLDGTISYFATISLYLSKFPFHITRVYPNPASGLLSIEFVNSSLDNLELGLVNTLGQVVYRQTIGGNERKIELDCSKFQKGLYLLKLGDVWEKIVIK